MPKSRICGLASCVVFSLVGATLAHATRDGLPPPGIVEFRAVGHDPRWFLEVDGKGAAHLSMAGGGGIVHVSTRGFGVGPRSSGLIYGAVTETRAFVAEIVEIDCLDAISGERLTHTVTIRLDSREYRGCGRGYKTSDTASND